ncbi:MAG: hypothetical protein A3F67_01560 [Verrucomicrobia bacterium RIFCSPHIGHO2_12_FULL_41_10]|nr:MAG: hypothetical protein A3F67_01560 [Verrucomicrobia bacterium RIFCSPHIGHO2_12_FULL_41_10]
MSDLFNSYKMDWILFTEAGFIAVNQADEDSAKKLLKTAEMLNPKATLPKVALGYLHLHKLELKQAVKLYEEVLAQEPDNDMAKTLLGICLGLMPNAVTKGEKVLDQVLQSKDPMLQQLSSTALDFINKFVKKPPGPVGP